MARHFAGHNTVAFFELFNEPTTYRNQLGPVSWDAWKKSVEEQITIIRAYNPQVIPLVAGFDWAYDLTPLLLSPIAAEGIGYTTHPYANKRPQPWEPRWEEDFGFAADKYPVIATEFGGFASPPSTNAQPAAETNEKAPRNAAYGPAIIKYSRRERHQLDRLVFRSGMGADTNQELELRAESLGRVRQGRHEWRDQIENLRTSPEAFDETHATRDFFLVRGAHPTCPP